MLDESETFGAPEKVALARRSGSLWRLLRDDPRFAYYGRLVALSDTSGNTAEILAALARLQGASVCYFYPKSRAERLLAEIEALGLSTDRHEHYWGGDAALAASRRVQSEHVLPKDLSVVALDADTPRELVADVAALCQSCDVMPVPGPIMRGQAQQGVCLAAINGTGQPVATASSYVLHHRASPHATDVFWGMLATREDRRGERIALLLGAQAIIHMWQQHGARGFMTGARADNPSSQALCRRLGVGPTEWIYASCIDRTLLEASSVTK